MTTAGRSLRSWAARLVDPAAPAAALTVLGVLETALDDGSDPLWSHLLATVGMTVPLALLRRAPLAAVVTVFGSLLYLAHTGAANRSMFVVFACAIAAYGVGAFSPPRRAVIGMGVIAAALVALIPFGGGEDADAGPGDAVFLGVLFGLPWALGVALHRRRGENESLTATVEELDRERRRLAEEAVAAERARIARELHDVVAHSVSVIAVQTAAVRRRIQAEHPTEADSLRAVEATSRQALGEMRRLLGVLRPTADAPTTEPQPGLRDLDMLAVQVRASGLSVELDVEASRPELSPGLELAAYRIVQESLTNTLKHGGAGAAATVRIRFHRDRLDVSVVDTGCATSPSRPGGHGLVGMRERAALYGGTVTAAPKADGGFAVHAVLPIDSGTRA